MQGNVVFLSSYNCFLNKNNTTSVISHSLLSTNCEVGLACWS